MTRLFNELSIFRNQTVVLIKIMKCKIYITVNFIYID